MSCNRYPCRCCWRGTSIYDPFSPCRMEPGEPGRFRFVKVDENYDGVMGAAFALYRGGVPIATALSADDGVVDFSALAPGEYRLRETLAPPGFLCDPASYRVVVQPGGVTVNNMPQCTFCVRNAPLI